jgi:sortase A
LKQYSSTRFLLTVFAVSLTLLAGACSSGGSSGSDTSSDDSEVAPTPKQETDQIGVPDVDDTESSATDDAQEAGSDDAAEPEPVAQPDDSRTDDAVQANEEVIAEETIPGNPVELRIDTIDVAAGFEYVGLTEDGDMDAPEDWDSVAWYEPGTVPGDRGNAAIAGHFDSPTGQGVFYRLNDLVDGDHVTIITDQGEELVFEVIEVERFHINDAPLEKIFGQTDERNMNLITCDGVWDSAAGTYEERLVVYTRLIEG